MALKQKSNRTYSGLKADKPATLPAGSIFVDEETPAVWVAKTDETLELISARPYKVYSALISQTGTNNPTLNVLENTLGTTVTATRSSEGFYVLTFADDLSDVNKIFILTGNPIIGNSDNGATNVINIEDVGVGSITISTQLPSTPIQDGFLYNTAIEIRVYN